ncbi:FmdB family zinc ribbon protein [Micromonospora fulviviridis]|uniref:FmdB family zinc ribbon protein n=1 Tax=Micromonospora fulviviridis TaxID=47860 RepID=A0ABV2VKV0_9ACTN
MPTYQYACTACGHQLEAVQSFSDAPLTECPACEGRLRKVFNSVGIVFKGSGFYRTDSRSSGSESATSTNGKPAKSESTSGSSGSSATGSSNGSSAASSSSSSGSSSGKASAASSSS